MTIRGDRMIKHWQTGLAAVATLLLVAPTPTRAADPPGVLWQTTSQMVMPGMPFSPPPNTMQICAAKDSNQPPPPGQTCTMTNVQRSGNKLTWDTQCKGEIKFSADGVTMTTKLTGKKLGTCDKPIG